MYSALQCVGTYCLILYNTSISVPNHSRQAIPLAIVQADTLAAAKQPSNEDASNSTTNVTSPQNKASSKEHSLLHKSISLQDASSVASASKGVWRIAHQTGNDILNTQGTVIGGSEDAKNNDDADDALNGEQGFEGMSYALSRDTFSMISLVAE